MTQIESNIERFNIQRKIVATMTTESWTNIPHVSFVYKADITEFLEEYRKFNDATPYNLSLNTAILKVISEGIKAAPKMNAHMHYEKKLVRGKITYLDNIDISVPWTLPDGHMMTITMKDVGNKSLKEMAEYTDDINRRLQKTNLTEALYTLSINDTLRRLREGHFLNSILKLYGSKTNPRHRVSPLKGKAKKEYNAIPDTDKIVYDDLKQGTLTVSNIGASTRGVKGYFDMLMIIPPQICAIGLSAIQREPVVMTDENGNEKLEIRTILPMAVCFDHRALDFGEVSPFLKKLDEIFANPEMILIDK